MKVSASASRIYPGGAVGGVQAESSYYDNVVNALVDLGHQLNQDLGEWHPESVENDQTPPAYDITLEVHER